jgi:hypothetical protein
MEHVIEAVAAIITSTERKPNRGLKRALKVS